MYHDIYFNGVFVLTLQVVVFKCAEEIQEHFPGDFESFKQISLLYQGNMIFSYSDDREVWNVVHLEDGVGDAGEGSPVRDGVYPEHVHAPLLRILQDLQLVLLILMSPQLKS